MSEGRSPSEGELAEENAKKETNADDVKNVQNSNMVKETSDNLREGADEKMLVDEEKKISFTKASPVDAKFTTDKKNGDTKVDVFEIKQEFVGLTKEELMKYCNDPFWVRLRWFMFILFWLIWLGMLVGAIFIIVQAPKCSPPTPKTWWQKGPIIDLDADDDSQDRSTYIADLNNKLPYLSAFAGAFVSEKLNPGSDAYDIPTEVSEIKQLIETAKSNKINLILDLTANYVNKSNEWFVKSEAGEEPYSSYFIWRKSKSSDANEIEVPNNWVSILNESAWSYSEKRKMFYLHQIDKNFPDLNFSNPVVVKEFDKVLRFWLENGFSGIRLKFAKHLLVDPKFEDERQNPSSKGVHTDYDFNIHDKTTYQEGLSDIFAHWRNIVQNYTSGQGLFMLNDDLSDAPNVLSINGEIVIDLPQASQLIRYQPMKLTADQIYNSVDGTFKKFGLNVWPAWQYSIPSDELSSEFRLITSYLPGTPIVSWNQVMLEDNNTTKVDPDYEKMTALRTSPSMLYGEFNSSVISDGSIFAYTRLKSGNPGIVVLYNPTDKLVQANLTFIHKIPDEVTVNYFSKNFVENIAVKDKIKSKDIHVSGKSAIILTYVPED